MRGLGAEGISSSFWLSWIHEYQSPGLISVSHQGRPSKPHTLVTLPRPGCRLLLMDAQGDTSDPSSPAQRGPLRKAPIVFPSHIWLWSFSLANRKLTPPGNKQTKQKTHESLGFVTCKQIKQPILNTSSPRAPRTHFTIFNSLRIKQHVKREKLVHPSLLKANLEFGGLFRFAHISGPAPKSLAVRNKPYLDTFFFSFGTLLPPLRSTNGPQNLHSSSLSNSTPPVSS